MDNAIHLKEMNPDMNVFVLYRDMRTYGEREVLYKKARGMGVIFIRFSLDKKPQVTVGGRPARGGDVTTSSAVRWRSRPTW